MVTYDAGVLTGYAERLYRRAQAMLYAGAIVGAPTGFVVGGVAFLYILQWTSIREEWNQEAIERTRNACWIVGVLLGVLVGGLLGMMAGQRLRIRAQRTLCAVRVEQHLAALDGTAR